MEGYGTGNACWCLAANAWWVALWAYMICSYVVAVWLKLVSPILIFLIKKNVCLWVCKRFWKELNSTVVNFLSCCRFGDTSCQSDNNDMFLYLGRIDDVITAGVQYGVSALFPNVWKCCLVCVCVLFEADAAEFAAVRIERHRTETGRDKCEKSSACSGILSSWFTVNSCIRCVLVMFRAWCRQWRTHSPDLSFKKNRQLTVRENIGRQWASDQYGDALEEAEVSRTGQTGGNEGTGGGVYHALLQR